MNIVILGHVCIDKNISEHASYIAPGSPAMFLSKIFRQLPDCTTTVITPYGKDFLPYVTDSILYPKNPTTRHTLVYENITKAKTRAQKALFSEEAQPVLLNSEMVEKLQQADILYIAPITPNFSPEYIQTVMQVVHKRCLVVLSPQGYFRQFDSNHHVVFREFFEADEILPFINFVIVSEQDYPEMESVAGEWVQKHKLTVLVTKGDRGADIFTKSEVMHVATNPVAEKDIIDSVGSGDIFSAGFGYWYQKTKDVISSVKFGNKLARECLFYVSDRIQIDYNLLTNE